MLKKIFGLLGTPEQKAVPTHFLNCLCTSKLLCVSKVNKHLLHSFIHLIRWPTCKDIDACIEREDAKRAVVCSGCSWGCVARAADTEPANILFTVNAAFKCFNQTGSIFRTVWFIRVCVYYLSLPESDISMGSFASFNSTSTRIYCLLSEADGRRAAQGIQRALTATCCNNFIHQIFQMCIYANISGTC